MYFFIFNQCAFFSLSRFGSKTVVQNVNVKTAEVIPEDAKEVSHELKQNTLSAYYIYLFIMKSFYKAMYIILLFHYH